MCREITINSNQISQTINGTRFSLSIVHRLSPAIQKAIQQLIPTLGNLANLTNMADHQTQIRLCNTVSQDQEVEYIWKEAQKAPRVGKTSAILLPNARAILEFVEKIVTQERKSPWVPVGNSRGIDFDKLNNHLQEQGIKLQYVGNRYGNLKKTDYVIIMTYYSAKGLDFDNVFLPDVDNRMYITPNPNLSRRIFMVAMTRSRNNL